MSDGVERRFSRSLECGLSILACFSTAQPVRAVADLADELGLSRSSAHRYVATLAELGYLEQLGDGYRLGMRVTDLGLSSLDATGLRERARPYLAELQRHSALTVSLAVLDGEEVIYLERLRGSRSALELPIESGSRLPAHCTALGKVLLAHLPEPERRRLLSTARLTGHAPNTITDTGALRNELERVRRQGLAVDNEEFTPGSLAIAAAVHDGDDEVVGAIDIATEVLTISLAGLREALGGPLTRTAAEISKRLGHRGE